MKWVRSLLAVAVGYAATAGIIHYLAPASGEGMEYFLATAAWVAGAALVGGFVTALISDGHELAHAGGLGFLLIATSVAAMRHSGEARPGWYETSIAACGPMAALLGAAIWLLVKPRRAGATQPVSGTR